MSAQDIAQISTILIGEQNFNAFLRQLQMQHFIEGRIHLSDLESLLLDNSDSRIRILSEMVKEINNEIKISSELITKRALEEMKKDD